MIMVAFIIGVLLGIVAGIYWEQECSRIIISNNTRDMFLDVEEKEK